MSQSQVLPLLIHVSPICFISSPFFIHSSICLYDNDVVLVVYCKIGSIVLHLSFYSVTSCVCFFYGCVTGLLAFSRWGSVYRCSMSYLVQNLILLCVFIFILCVFTLQGVHESYYFRRRVKNVSVNIRNQFCGLNMKGKYFHQIHWCILWSKRNSKCYIRVDPINFIFDYICYLGLTFILLK